MLFVAATERISSDFPGLHAGWSLLPAWQIASSPGMNTLRPIKERLKTVAIFKPSTPWRTIDGAPSVPFLAEPCDYPLDPGIVTDTGGHKGRGREACSLDLRRPCV